MQSPALEDRYDQRFKAVFDAVRRLLETPRRRRGLVGFGVPTEPDSDAHGGLSLAC